MMSAMRVAVTLEHLWHRVPGGTAVASLELLRALAELDDAPELVGIAGRHAQPPEPTWRPPAAVTMRKHRWLHGPWLYEAWLRAGRPRAEAIAGAVDVVHAATIIPAPSRAPLVVTLHDLAFLHQPEHFTPRGVSVFRRSLAVLRQRAAMVMCSSQATLDDALRGGFEAERLRLVPLGVRAVAVSDGDRQRVRAAYGLPERYVLFVGTVEPRKNLARLVQAMALLDHPPSLVLAGASGWGDVERHVHDTSLGASLDIRFLGFVPADDLPALYAQAAAFCMPSLREGYGLPVLEAMAQGTPVVTSRGTATQETAGGAAVLVDPLDPADIARGLYEVLEHPDRFRTLGRARARSAGWDTTARATLGVYREVAP